MEYRSIDIGPDCLAKMDIQSDVMLVKCPDPRVRSVQKVVIRRGLRLGARDEEYVEIPVLGGGAIFAHPEGFPAELEMIRTALETMSAHFGVYRMVAIGHEGCKRMGEFHLETGGASGPDCVLEDMMTVRKMFEERSRTSQCPVRRMFAKFRISLDIVYMKLPSGGKLDYVLI